MYDGPLPRPFFFWQLVQGLGGTMRPPPTTLARLSAGSCGSAVPEHLHRAACSKRGRICEFARVLRAVGVLGWARLGWARQGRVGEAGKEEPGGCWVRDWEIG